MKDFDKSFIYKLRVLWAYKDLLRNHFQPVSKKYFKRCRQSQLNAAKRLKGKEVLDVAFFLTIPGMWKTDEVFKAMSRNPHYHPFVVIYPYSIYKEFDKKEVLATIERTKTFVENKGYEYIIPYDEGKKRWVDAKKLTNID